MNSRHIVIVSIVCIYVTVVIPAAVAEKYNSGWQLNIDNNVFQRYMKDRDYTGGIAFSVSGKQAQSGWLNVDPVRTWVFDNTGLISHHETDIEKHNVQYGVIFITPDDITATEPILDDRPFASLFFLTSTELTFSAGSDVAYRSGFSLGILGLDLAGEIQKGLHHVTGSDDANGWGNQISAGGEPTAKLTYSAQYKISASGNHQASTYVEGNIGYSTDFNAAVNWRWGRLNTPWWSFNPSHYDYIALPAASARGIQGSSPEVYLFAGFDIKYRLYNSMLQGQFRQSAHTLSRGEIEPLLLSATTGVTREFGDNLRVSLFVRGVSPEIKGPNARNLWWASLEIKRAW